VIRNGFITLQLAAVTFFLGCGNEGTQGALLLTLFHIPVQAVLHPLVASKFLGILQKTVGVSVLERIFPLSIHIGQADLDGTQFIPSDPSCQDFLTALFGVKTPKGVLFHHRDWKRSILISNRENYLVGGLLQSVFLTVQFEELLSP